MSQHFLFARLLGSAQISCSLCTSCHLLLHYGTIDYHPLAYFLIMLLPDPNHSLPTIGLFIDCTYAWSQPSTCYKTPSCSPPGGAIPRPATWHWHAAKPISNIRSSGGNQLVLRSCASFESAPPARGICVYIYSFGYCVNRSTATAIGLWAWLLTVMWKDHAQFWNIV